MKNFYNILKMYAISPVHAGAESSVGAIDNPIQREVHTNYPCIHANGVKGALRDQVRNSQGSFNLGDGNTNYSELVNLLFGYDGDNDAQRNQLLAKDPKDETKLKSEDIPGLLAVSDAKIFAMPVRSNLYPFIHVTSNHILKRTITDFAFSGKNLKMPADLPTGDNAKLIGDIPENGNNHVILEEASVEIKGTINNNELLELFPEIDRLLVVSDDMFGYIAQNCTEVQTQIKIDEETGTAKDGALRYEELLPADSAMYSLLFLGNLSKCFLKNDLQVEIMQKTINDLLKSEFSDYLQIGGDQTLGRGICKLHWHNEEVK